MEDFDQSYARGAIYTRDNRGVITGDKVGEKSGFRDRSVGARPKS